MNKIKTENIPQALSEQPNWVLWKTVPRNGNPTKVPFQRGGVEAKSNDAATWGELSDVLPDVDGYDGVGFVFREGGDLCGVDLDGCRDPKTGGVAEWAREVILKLNTYAEVSPSRTGVKLFLRGRSPFDTGKKLDISDAPKVCEKTPAVEIYDKLRYFAVTGWRLKGPTEPLENVEGLVWLKKRFWADKAGAIAPDFYSEPAVIERARKYLCKLPPSVSGQKGHDKAFHASCVLVLGFGLSQGDALLLMGEWNQLCTPPWSERELLHKVTQAAKQPGERNYLRNARQEQWDRIRVPEYRSKRAEPEKKITTLADAAQKYLDVIRSGKSSLIELGIPDLDYAIGGGVERGEMVILAARPSHGKSAVALQCVHAWTGAGRKVLVVSEEMSALALGKRTLQFVSDVPQEHWKTSIEEVEGELAQYVETHAQAIVVESCVTSVSVAEEIDKAVAEHGITAAVVDYAQLLKSEGKTRYEQITNTSVLLRQVASQHNLVLLVLCQLNRAVESRNKFMPVISDLKDTGQLEQDADVIVLMCWPHRIDSKEDPHKFQFFIGKNRNRAINQPTVQCRFEPSRQRIVMPKAKDMKNYEHSFDNW